MAEEITTLPQEYEPHPFEQEMLKRVVQDFRDAKKFLDPYHRLVDEIYEHYHNARRFQSMRKNYLFPVPLIQEFCDQFVAHMQDKVWYKSRPCTIVGREETDKSDANVKQEMLDYQDYKDDMYAKVKQWWRDVFLYRIAVAQIDYDEEYRGKYEDVEIPLTWKSEVGPQPMVDPSTGQVMTRLERQYKKELVFKGPRTKRISPRDLYFGQDKCSMLDEMPVMIRSDRTKQFFKSKPYFKNAEWIKDGDRSDESYDIQTRRRMFDVEVEAARSKKSVEYVEWQGQVSKTKLYDYLGEDTAEIEEHEMCWAIVGVANGDVVVRLHESAFEFDGPNIIVGFIEPEEDEFMGVSVADKILGMQRGLDSLMGMAMTDFKKSVNRASIIKESAVLNEGDIRLNDAGFVLRTNDDVDKVFKDIPAANISKDFYEFYNLFYQMARNASGLSSIMTGKGEAAADTLGEANLAAEQGSQIMRDHLKCFEDTFIQPLYEKRNAINEQFLDAPYVYGVIGDGVIDWRMAQPAQIRAAVDFICESSVRETNRNIITQQTIQFLDAATGAIQAGFIVRLDKILEQLAESGFSWRQEIIDAVLPTIAMEKQGVDVNGMLLARQMQQQQAETIKAAGGPFPEPTSEEDAVASAQQRNQTQLGGTNL